MSTAVIDVLPRGSLVFDVASCWVAAGLVQPMAWCRRTSLAHTGDETISPSEGGTAQGQWEWRVVAADHSDGGDLTEVGEVLNHLGARASLQLVVLAAFTNSIEERADSVWLEATLALLDRDFGPQPVRRTLLLVPCAGSERHGDLDESLLGLGWNEVIIVAAEDSPAPDLGNELAARPLDACAAHVLMGVADQWVSSGGGPRVAEGGRHAGERARLARHWTRVIDAGFVVDHVAADLVRLETLHHTPAKTRIDAALLRILSIDAVRNDLKIVPPDRGEGVPQGWSYVWGFFKYFARNGLKIVVEVVLARILRPVRRAINALLDWFLHLLGTPRKKPERPTEIERENAEPPSLLQRAQAFLESIDSGGELSEPPPAVPEVWREIIRTVLDEVDSRNLSVDEAVGIPRQGMYVPLMTELERHYKAPIRDLRKRAGDIVEELKAESSTTQEEDVEAREQIQRRLRRRRFVRRLLRTIGILILAVGVAVIVLGSQLLGIIIVGLMVVRWVIGGFLALLRVVASRYRESFPPDDDESYRAVLLEFWLDALARYTYRCSHLSGWSRALRVLMEGIASGPPLRDDEQRPFNPSYAPRAMTLATGVADRDHLVEIAEGIRQSDGGRTLYSTAWTQLLEEHADVFQHRWRHSRRGALGRLLEIEVNGLPSVVRSVGRSLVTSALSGADATRLLAGVVPWSRRRDRHGAETLSMPEGLAPLGPVGRVGAVEQPETAIAALDAATALVLGGDGSVAGLATVLAGSTRLVLTAAQLAQEGTTVELLGVGVVTPRVLDGRLAVIDAPLSSDGVVLGGIDAARLGRSVVTAAFSDVGTAPRVMTIESVVDDGTFVLDAPVPLGSPVLDAESGSLLGVVVAVGPTLVVGPAVIRRLVMAGGAAAPPPHELELDPGLQIPIDVAMGSVAVGGQGRTRPGWSGPSIDALEFLSRVNAKSDAFLPTLVADSHMCAVDADSERLWPLSDSESRGIGWMLGEGRALLCHHRLQLSAEFEVERFRQILSSEVAAPRLQPDDDGDAE